jgi:hypothetical protein
MKAKMTVLSTILALVSGFLLASTNVLAGTSDQGITSRSGQPVNSQEVLRVFVLPVVPFEAADLDRNGSLSQNEYDTAVSGTMRNLNEVTDVDRNGYLSQNEYDTAVNGKMRELNQEDNAFNNEVSVRK